MADETVKLELKPGKVGLLVLAPLAVISISFALMPLAGVPLDPLAKAVVENGHAEAAGRLKMLATWLLLLGIGCACVGYFIMNLRLFEPRTQRWLIGAFAVLAMGGGVPILYGAAEGPRLIGEKAICNAFASHRADQSGGQEQASNAAAGAATDNSLETYHLSPPTSLSEGLSFLRQPDCRPEAASWQMTRMWQLNLVQRLLLTLVSPALVLGTIACLARPLTDPAKPQPVSAKPLAEPAKSLPEDLTARPEDATAPSEPTKPEGLNPAERLKAHLYLTATLFVSGLLFLSALLRWPAFAFQGAGHDAYLAHVDAFVLYWGVTYTLYIASYYVPVALLLSAQGKRDGVAEDKLPAGQLLDWTKTLAALFAPAIVGLLGNVIHL